ncbi:hypothetical protein ACRAWD_05685 [Caulobacter segnis]
MSRALTPPASKTLTSKSHIETLRKDAKRWLKALRAGDPAARLRLRQPGPRPRPSPACATSSTPRPRIRPGELDRPDGRLDDLAIERQSRAQRVEQISRHGWTASQPSPGGS